MSSRLEAERRVLNSLKQDHPGLSQRHRQHRDDGQHLHHAIVQPKTPAEYTGCYGVIRWHLCVSPPSGSWYRRWII